MAKKLGINNLKSKIKLFLKKNYLITSGLVLLLIFFGWRYHQIRILSFNAQKINSTKSTGIKPVYVKSYPVGVDIEVGQTTINNGVWAILPDKVSYLIDSAGIGDSGNIIMYGHNNDDIFGPIRWIKMGAIIEVTGSDSKVYQYEVVKTDTVDPNNLEYIKNTDEEILTLYTCTGFLDSKRFIVVAKRLDDPQSAKPLEVMETVKNKITVIGTKVQTATAKPIVNTSSVYITYYGFNDNDPPGRAIAYPKSEYGNAIHNEASGVGTYENPLTFASDPDLYPVGTRLYVPYIKKYVVMEDLCATCSKNYKSGRKHIDIWAGGDGSNPDALYECENRWTRESETIEVNPPAGREVSLTPLCF